MITIHKLLFRKTSTPIHLKCWQMTTRTTEDFVVKMNIAIIVFRKCNGCKGWKKRLRYKRVQMSLDINFFTKLILKITAFGFTS
jgi:predicted metal-binding protein